MADIGAEPVGDRAVSPVVGTILLVGIVVVLSAAIGTFVVGLGADLHGGAQAGVDATSIAKNGANGTVTVTAVSLSSADYVEVTATVDSTSGSRVRNDTTTGDEVAARLEDAGESVTFEEITDGGAEDTTVRLLAVARTANNEAVVMDREVEL